jgi:hypothetical protein
MATDGAADLAALYPIARSVTIDGRAVAIQPPTLRRLAQYDQLAAALWALGDAADTADEVLFEEHPEAATDMLAAVIDADREWLLNLPPFRKLDLFSAWLEFNADFLADRLRTRMRLQLAVAAVHGAGPTQSPTSQSTESKTRPDSLRSEQALSKGQSNAAKAATGAPA